MKFFWSALIATGVLLLPVARAAESLVTTAPDATPRELYGASRLGDALSSAGVRLAPGAKILAGTRSSTVFAGVSNLPPVPERPEGFALKRDGNDWLIVGSDASGVLYGCLEMARRVAMEKRLPDKLDFTDHPAFKIRGNNLFWMKQGSYDWAVTPENFPWFFDRALMLRYLDELVNNRYNTIYFWNGHPFVYFLRLPKFPEAQVLSEADLKRNMDQLQWFTQEADRRGIWTVLHFYNIHVSPAFAKAHEREGVHLQNGASTPLLEAYMRHAVSEFVNTYPNVGLMLTAGEALYIKAEEFVRDAIIAGIKDTAKHPPLIVRQWTIDPYRYRDIIKPAYDNLFTMMKHNTEMIVSPYPDPRNATWISFGQNHIINVHENGDIKPFRWGSPVFIQQMTRIWKSMGVAGFHLYPAVSWDWPVALDRADPALSTIDRDRMWIEAFGRYGWNPDRPAVGEENFWKDRLASRYGGAAAGKAVYDYYVKTGPVMPALQNTVNVFNMNFHPLAISQEATLNGILHSDRWEEVGDYLARPLDDLTLERFQQKFGPVTEAARKEPPLSVKQWVAAQTSGKKAEGIDPIRLSQVLAGMAEDALAGLKSAHPQVADNPEYGRFVTDAECVLHLARFYRAKLEAATEKGLFDATGDDRHYDRMLQLAAESTGHYAALEETANRTYRHATDLGYYYRWEVVRKGFEQETAFYREQAAIASRGADVVYLGLDGPMSDATNEFHWLLERSRDTAGWSSQSYHLESNLFSRAKLAVAYDTFSPIFTRHQAQLEQWIRGGGRLLIWDPMGRGASGPLLDGISFAQNASVRPGNRIQYLEGGHALLDGLAGSFLTLDKGAALSCSIRSASGDWQELAYTVMHSGAGDQFYRGDDTFGPRWTSLMDTARVPILLVRKLGKGEIVVAQMGRWNIGAQKNMEEVRKRAAESPLAHFADNVVRWAGRR
ncbi:MAG: hypothetical protein U0Q18_11830 [Bryobacteraceae bacterium]